MTDIPQSWLDARLALLDREKALTRARDDLAAARRALPRIPVTRDYQFQGPQGPLSLADLFGTRSQLIIQHFMFGADWEAGCPSCSFWADGFNGTTAHLDARDTALVLVSAAPIDKLMAYRSRMGWDLPWVSSQGSSFNRDMGVSFTQDEMTSDTFRYNYADKGFPASEAPGLSTFERAADGTIHYCYSTYGRGLDAMNVAYQLLDLTPKGRDEADLPHPMAWLKRHDDYAT